MEGSIFHLSCGQINRPFGSFIPDVCKLLAKESIFIVGAASFSSDSQVFD